MKTRFFIYLIFIFASIIPNSLYADDITGSIDNGRISWHLYKSDSSLYVNGNGQLWDIYYSAKVFVDGDSMQVGLFGGFRSISSMVRKVVIGEGITSLGINTFQDFCNLREVYLPNSLKLIDYAAFSGCHFHFTKFHMPRNIKRLGVTSLGTNGPFGEFMVFDTLYWDVEEMENSISYMELRSVKNVVIGENSRVLPEGFCDYNDSLTSVEIPRNVLKMGSRDFSNCSNLSNVILNEGLEELGYGVFDNCPTITQISLPSTLQIMHSEFENTSLVDITIPKNIKELCHLKCGTLRRVNYNAINATANGGLLELLVDSLELYLGENVEKLNNNCFHGKIKNRIDIPNSVKYIGENVFNGQKIGSLPPVLDFVGRYAFSFADFGDSINLPKIGIIENMAFSHSPTLKKLIINEVDSIKDGAFMFCPLEYVEVTITTPPYLGSIPFYNTPITEIIVPSCECIDAYEEKWTTAKDTYVNQVIFVNKIPCNQESVYDINLDQRDYKIRKIIRDGTIILYIPDGREYNLLGEQIKKKHD